jgi:hypothetical protein
MINASNPTKRIVMYKCGNTISRGMKIFQIKENNAQQIMVVPTKAIKELQKDGII